MNESNELIEGKKSKRIKILEKNLKKKVKLNKAFTLRRNIRNKYIFFTCGILVFIGLFIMIYFKFIKKGKKDNINQLSLEKKSYISVKEEIYKKLEQYTNSSNPGCDELDPINIFKKRLNSPPTTICENDDTNSNHICYKDGNPLFVAQNGVLCKFNNIILDPSKWKADGNTYKGPMDPNNRGCPLLSKGFFNMKCKKGKLTEYSGYDFIYNNYFNGWDYDLDEGEYRNETIEELAKDKTVFFISRNQDSPNLYHGGSEFVNALAIMYLFELDPEDIQIVFLESIFILINDDPFYDLYKNLIGRAGEPINIRNMTKKYRISQGVHIPINWDSPCFIQASVPKCENPIKTYILYNKLIDFFMKPTKYIDSFNSDKEIFYYPKSILDNKDKNKFTITLTFQWRRVWPKGRKGQQRILGNGPELADKLASALPENILLKLIDTASLPIQEQINIMRSTDYFVGIHGAGLSLILYAPKECIFHEVLPASNMNGLLLFAALSGHKTYSDIINSDIRDVDGNENIFFKEDDFVNSVISHLRENNLMK